MQPAVLSPSPVKNTNDCRSASCLMLPCGWALRCSTSRLEAVRMLMQFQRGERERRAIAAHVTRDASEAQDCYCLWLPSYGLARLGSGTQTPLQTLLHAHSSCIVCCHSSCCVVNAMHVQHWAGGPSVFKRTCNNSYHGIAKRSVHARNKQYTALHAVHEDALVKAHTPTPTPTHPHGRAQAMRL